MLFWENFWTSRPSFLQLQNGDNTQLSFASLWGVAEERDRKTLCSVKLFVFLEPVSSLFPLLLMSKQSWNDELVVEEETGAYGGKWLSKAPEWVGVLGSKPTFVTIWQIPPFSTSLICPCLRPTQGETETSGRGVSFLKPWRGWEETLVWLLWVLRFLLTAPCAQQWLVTWVFGFWVIEQACNSEGLWCAWQQAGISQKAKLLVLTPEPTYSGWKSKPSDPQLS